MMLWQSPLPPRYSRLSDQELKEAIAARKAELGAKLVILGHHYQQDQVIAFADFTGDSFKLSQLAAGRVQETGASYVIFAGVHFMAESADILTPDEVAVILPDLGAGCSMADMANHEDTLDAWAEIHEALGWAPPEVVDESGTEFLAQSIHTQQSSAGGVAPMGASPGRVIPICYMNSTAAIKAFCGRNGGAVCTSSNCGRVFAWALAGGTQPRREGESIKILFLPDQHLGRNTAAALGYDVTADMAVWDPKHPDGLGGLEAEEVQRATFLLWKGHCSVHKLFRPEHVDQVRAQWPSVTVIVHPECEHAVVQKADMTGSTEGIIEAIEKAASGSYWAVGTEVHLVNRLAQEAAKRNVRVRILSECQCLCTTMYRIDMPHLLWVMDELAAGRVVNRITVPAEVKKWALKALDRMLALAGSAQAPRTAAVGGGMGGDS
ncbi:MAG: quinolinate synthase NadA [Phycisphaeraceae bacterium]|nr:quinolinate synthase NadA [Phycisphaeraceae bacterium]